MQHNYAGNNAMHRWLARQGPGGGVVGGGGSAAPSVPDDTASSTTSLGPTRGGTGAGDDTTSNTRTRTTIPPTTTLPPTSTRTTTQPPVDTTTSSEEEEEVSTTTVQSTTTSTSTSELPTTSETSSTTSSTIVEETTTSAQTTATTSATRALVTSFVTASASIPTLASSATNSLANANNDSDSSSGPSAGTVVGIVAGALIGVVVLSGIVGYIFRTKCTNKNEDEDFDGENPFGNMDDGFGGRAGASRSELRRDSQLLGGGEDGDSIHQMSELGHLGGANNNSYSNLAGAAAVGAGAAAAGGAGAYALHRDNSTSLPGLQRNDTVNPRPPTMIQRHYANQLHSAGTQNNNGGGGGGYNDMPSFQPGQLVYPSSAPAIQSSPYPTFPPGGSGSVPVGGVFPTSLPGQDYGHQQQQQHNFNQYDHATGDSGMPMRSGTPEYDNPQQYFHQASESFSSGTGMAGPSPFADQNAAVGLAQPYLSKEQQHSHQQQQYSQQQHQMAHQAAATDYLQPDSQYPEYSQGAAPREQTMKGSERAKRTLSVRNGGAHEDDGFNRDSIYGGM